MDTIIIVHNHGDKKAIKFIKDLDGTPTRFGIIKTLVREWDSGIGASFKSFDFAYKVFLHEYDEWVFVEDNVWIIESNYLSLAREQIKLDNKTAFLGMMRCQPNAPVVDKKITQGRAYSSEERQLRPPIWHAHGGCGYTTKKFLQKMVNRFGSLPYSKMVKPGNPNDILDENNFWYRDVEQNGEVSFTSQYYKLGYCVREIQHNKPFTYYKWDNSYA